MNRLKERRAQRKMTQEEVANVLGISRSRYTQLENNPDKLTIEQAHILCDLYKCSMNTLFFKSKGQLNEQ